MKQDYIDAQGIPRRVLIPEGEDPAQGIPISLDLDDLYGHLPTEFRRRLYEEFHAQGLVEACDFLRPEAGNRFRAAMLSLIKHDWLSVTAIAREQCHDR